ncbi:Oidioi.mRNA.OKI2018_I69.chr1.g1826.t1.cds [Oikopleura dioica]|uniref:selenide, water dikinase n=1 Tax=Oikopleura dioica TaxID=34765 RepID=A0ABN7STB8_OIKDI|nr:Oidioi.mRNA.OKI2018_I69.chr1.g1826.t1.cds [Oikopleura dioica]
MSVGKLFDPVSSGLEESFRLTRFSNLLGSACRAPAEVNKKLLERSPPEASPEQASVVQKSTYPPPRAVSGSCQIVRIDDPHIAGQAACAHCLAPIYAAGVVEVETVNLLMTSSTKMSDRERDVVLPKIVAGFQECCERANAIMTQSPLALNPSLTISGQVNAFMNVGSREFVASDAAQKGDVLVLTKPLGTHVACMAHMWMEQNQEKWNRLKQVVTEQDVERGYQDAMFNMVRLNRDASRFMAQFNAHGATAVAGYGILGHAKLLAKRQKKKVNFVIHNLPVLAKMNTIAKAMGNSFGLAKGVAPEISGGMLIALPREEAAKFCAELRRIEGHQAWIVGIVEDGEGDATVIERPRIIEVVTGADGSVQSAPPSSSSSRRGKTNSNSSTASSSSRPSGVQLLQKGPKSNNNSTSHQQQQSASNNRVSATQVSTIVPITSHAPNNYQQLSKQQQIQATSVIQNHSSAPTITMATPQNAQHHSRPLIHANQVHQNQQAATRPHHQHQRILPKIPVENKSTSGPTLTELQPTTSRSLAQAGHISVSRAEMNNAWYQTNQDHPQLMSQQQQQQQQHQVYNSQSPILNLHPHSQPAHPQSVIHSTLTSTHANNINQHRRNPNV